MTLEMNLVEKIIYDYQIRYGLKKPIRNETKNNCEKVFDTFMERYGINANDRDLDTYLYQEYTYAELKQYLDYFGKCGKNCKCRYLFHSMTRLANEPIHVND